MKKKLVENILIFESMFFGYTISDIRKLVYAVPEKFGINHNFNKNKKICRKKMVLRVHET